MALCVLGWAVGYAAHLLRDTGGRIVVLGSRGYHIITEHVPEPEGRVRRSLYAGAEETFKKAPKTKDKGQEQMERR